MILCNCVSYNIYWEKQGIYSHKIYLTIIIIIDSMCVFSDRPFTFQVLV